MDMRGLSSPLLPFLTAATNKHREQQLLQKLEFLSRASEKDLKILSYERWRCVRDYNDNLGLELSQREIKAYYITRGGEIEAE